METKFNMKFSVCFYEAKYAYDFIKNYKKVVHLHSFDNSMGYCFNISFDTFEDMMDFRYEWDSKNKEIWKSIRKEIEEERKERHKNSPWFVKLLSKIFG